MEFEQPMWTDINGGRDIAMSKAMISTTDAKRVSESSDGGDLIHRFEMFHKRQKGVAANDSAEKRLRWLRSQVVGGDAEFESPYGKRRLTYADHTASGRCLRFIENFIMQDVLPFYGNSHTSDSFVGCQTTKSVQEAAKYVKKCLGGAEDAAIIFCGSGTTAAIKRLQEVMGIAVPSILRERLLASCLTHEERWVVFVGPYEHHSNILSWRQSLAEVVEIGLDENGLIDMESLRLKLQFYQSRNRPLLGSFSACSNVTGIESDTRAIARLLHEHDAFACFDFATSGPYVEIDMRSGQMDGYDAIYLSPHKFLGGPGSPGVLLMSKSLYRLKASPPSTCGGGTVEFVNCFNEKDTLYYESIEEREDAGTPPIIQKIKSAIAFWVKEDYITHNVIQSMENYYIEKVLQRLLPNPNIKVLGNATAKRQAVVSFIIFTTTNSSPPEPNGDHHHSSEREGLNMWRETGNKRDKILHGAFVAKLLSDLFGIQARGGCACAGPYAHSLFSIDHLQSLTRRRAVEQGFGGLRHGWTRVSFAYYMSHAELEFIIAAIEFTAIYGQRFLPLYDFNWNTGAWCFKKQSLSEAISESIDDEHYQLQGSCFANSMVETKGNKEGSDDVRGRDGDAEAAALISKFANYLEVAKRIATMLSKCPAQRHIPKGVDPDLVYFRV